MQIDNFVVHFFFSHPFVLDTWLAQNALHPPRLWSPAYAVTPLERRIRTSSQAEYMHHVMRTNIPHPLGLIECLKMLIKMLGYIQIDLEEDAVAAGYESGAAAERDGQAFLEAAGLTQAHLEQILRAQPPPGYDEAPQANSAAAAAAAAVAGDNAARAPVVQQHHQMQERAALELHRRNLVFGPNDMEVAGECALTAIWHHFGEDATLHPRRLRAHLVQYLRERPERLRHLLQYNDALDGRVRTPQQYLEHLRDRRTYLGHRELQTVADMLEAHITVIADDGAVMVVHPQTWRQEPDGTMAGVDAVPLHRICLFHQVALEHYIVLVPNAGPSTQVDSGAGSRWIPRTCHACHLSHKAQRHSARETEFSLAHLWPRLEIRS